MSHRTITLCYRKLIDATASRPWDRLVFAATYQEFCLQAQYFNQQQRYRSLAELLQHAPGAAQLSFLVSGAVRGYLQQLGGWVPEIVDNLGRPFLRFSQFEFELLASDILDQAQHRLVVSFYSEPLVWHDTVGPYLLVSDPSAAGPAGAFATRLFQLQPYLAIHSLQLLP